MRLRTMLVLIFVAAMMFSVGGNAKPPDQISPSQYKFDGPLDIITSRLSFNGKVLRAAVGHVPSDGDQVYDWRCKAFLENYECTTEETCGVSTLWLYVTKTDPVQGALLCTMLSQAASSGDRAWVDGSCLQMKGSPWCELTGLQVFSLQFSDTGATDEEETEQSGSDDEATTQP